MSQSLLYHAFGVREGYEYEKTEYVEGRVEFHLSVKETMLVCPKCGHGRAARRGSRRRRIRTVPIGLKEVVLVAEVVRCQCGKCGHGFEVAPFLPGPTRTTRTGSRTSSAN
jgi:transposase